MHKKKEAYDSKKAKGDNHSSHYCIKGFVLAFQIMDLLLMHVHQKLYLKPDLCMHRFTVIDLSFTDSLMEPVDIASKIRSGGIEMEGGKYEEYKPAWMDVDFVFGPINIKQHWLMLAIDLERCTIFVFDSMPNYIGSDILDGYLKLVARAIPLMLISVGFDKQHKTVKYGQWEVKRSKVTLQEGKSLDCGTFCAKFVENCVTGANRADT
ncbi:uncharacterized protein LOC120089004 [Benincasa hispida]|uniref:uncharacterized protein LOC120089004 n=1 Tax=Benincasa hispida TaxID=102211 RepID=UPI00190158C4|nr:uncharacterized protein LOC120089004 [Benincasa hispida]